MNREHNATFLLKRIVLAILTTMFVFMNSTIISYAADFYNILLIGVDRRDDSWNGNSDVMMLLTVNEYTETVYLTSFLRDLYADIPGIGVQKLNAACANGGVELCVQTIEENYGVTIDNYAMVDFESMKDIVDAIGGIELEVTWDEAEVANGYIRDMCNTVGVDYSTHMFTSDGLVHADGYMAVGYARNRYSGYSSDFGRTQRQRNVMEAIFDKLMDGGATAISMALAKVLPYLSYDVSEIKLLQLMTKVPTWINYEIEEQHIPYDGEYYSENEILIPYDMQDTISKLTGTIYATE